MMQFISKKEDQNDRLPVAQGSCEPKFSHHEMMKAVTYGAASLLKGGAKEMMYGDHPKPLLTHEQDAIVHVEMSSISGCDLNLYSGLLPTADQGLILGHDAVGTIVDVGTGVTKFHKGDRVVVSFNLACGECHYCQQEEYSECDRTNDSKLFGQMYGGVRGPAAVFGYSRLLGNVPGTQAEYVRVPFADVNLYPVPKSVPNDKAVFASDILASGLHGVCLGEVKKGDIVGIWGLGPVGIAAGMWCKNYGARVIGIDRIPDRLKLAQRLDFETIDRTGLSCEQIVEKLHDRLPLARCSGGGVDCAIEAAGFRYAQATSNIIEQTLGMETDTSEMMMEMAMCVRKYGRIAILGDYIGAMNRFPMGHVMQKHLKVASGFVPTQKYFKQVMEALKDGTIDPTVMITQKLSLQDAPEAYGHLYKGEEGYIKVLLQNTVPLP